MKVPKKHQVSAYIASPGSITPNATVESLDYGHNDLFLGEVSGHIFNRYLTLEVREDYESLNKILRYKYGPTNPKKTQLYLQQYVSMFDVVTSRDSSYVIENIHQQAVEELLHKSFNAVDTVHKLENSLWERIKYVFTKKIK